MKTSLFLDTNKFAGTEMHVFELARALKDEGLDVKVICSKKSPFAEMVASEGIPVVSVETQGLLSWMAVFELRRLLISGDIDIIHVHNGRTAFLSAIAIVFAGRGRCVMTQHFICPRHVLFGFPKFFIYSLAHNWVNRRIKHFIAVSKVVYQAMVMRHDADIRKISIIPNGMCLPDPKKIEPPLKIREELGLCENEAFIVCASRLHPEKNITLLIDAMSIVLRSGLQAKCIIAGEGCQKDELLDRIKSLKLEEHVRLIGFYKDCLSLISAADVLVLPSSNEPFGLALIEAMSLKKAVVAIRSGGPLEIVIDGKTGLLANSSSSDDLARAVSRLLGDPKLCKEMGVNGFRRYQEEYTAERMARQTLDVYRRVM